MHNNYFFLAKLGIELEAVLEGFKFGEVFTQNKNELIVGLYKQEKSFYIKANLSPEFSCLSFPKEFHRARKNSVDVFKPIIDETINIVQATQSDRSLQIATKHQTLVFKLYGNRSNVLLFQGDLCVDIFKQKFDKDLQLKLSDLEKTLDLSFENFQRNQKKLSKFIPTLGKENLDFFLNNLDDNENQKYVWQELLKFIKTLSKNDVYISTENKLPKLLLYQSGEIQQVYKDPIKALNEFYQSYSQIYSLEKTRQQLLREKNKERKKAKNYIVKGEQKLAELKNGIKYNEIGDIIMANLHHIRSGTSEVELFNFYRNQPIQIKLKEELSPQKNAENYYRKAKNQKIEIAKLTNNIETKKVELKKIEDDIEVINNVQHYRDLKVFDKREKPAIEQKTLPYHIYRENDFQILVGKNAKKNDELTFKIAHKDDIWLHVKDAVGSHVVIRQIPGKNIGKEVLEKAASLAAWFSKRKTEGLVPVTHTQRKFVRKTKDLSAGQVIVEKEKTILAEPINWLDRN